MRRAATAFALALAVLPGVAAFTASPADPAGEKKEKALAACAEFVPVYAKPDTYPFVYARANGDDAVLVILNPAERGAEARFRLEPVAKGHRLLAGRAVEMTHDDGQYRITVPGRSYAIYRLVR